MKLEDFNLLLSDLDANPGREQVMNTALAFLEWIGIKPAKDGKGKLLAPKKEELKKYLTRHPVTNQFQLYKLSAEDEAITVRFAFLKKFRKDQITQLIDKESIVHFQGAPPIIQTLPSAPAYTFHIVATAEQNRLYVILNKGDQKRIVSFRRKLTQTQHQKIVPQWQGLGTKSKPEIAEQLWKSLDIKEVNKEFYKQIKEQFDALVGIAKTQAPKTNEEEAKQFAVRLIGRYIFCWFLKEKGIISETLLASATIRQHKKDFFQKYLYQLFFNTLNEEVPSRNPFKGEGGLEELYDTIPYLNGGLFEKHPEDKLFGVLDLNAWLVAFVHVLEDFDFTVDESSSQYQQVAIDPEMLGRIFENLLASQNPETEKMANQRKAFGAFYTPREIVDYMVNQALKSYLEEALLPKDESAAVVEEPLVEYKGTLFKDMEPRQTLINFDPAKKAIADQRRKRLQEHLDKFFSPDCASHPFDKGDVPLVQQKLSEVKILDPACGSGAFPMGVLLRLMELRQLVGHGHRNNYDLKSEILSRNIYGVDIMPMAVEIARLRAWLSLVLEAEYKPQDRKNNFGVSALPNLDFKFVCANTLIDSGYDAFLEKAEHNLTLMRLQGEVQKLERIRDSYFDPKGNKQKKEQLQKEFTDTKNYIKTEFVSLKKNWNLTDFLSKVDDWNPFDDSHPSTFFSPGWMFGIKEGFDVIIGNPPYVPGKSLTAETKRYLKDNFKLISGKYDLYLAFFERGIGLNKLGYKNLMFIVPNTLLANVNAMELRKYLVDSKQLKWIAIYKEVVFENQDVENVVVFINKNSSDDCFTLLDNNFQLIKKIEYQEVKKDSEYRIQIDKNDNDTVVINKIFIGTEKFGNISDICIGIQIGGSDENEKVKADYISDVKKNDTFQKVLDGKNFEPFAINWSNKFIKYGDWLHRKREEKYFLNPKIIIRQIGVTPIATIDFDNFYTLNTIYNSIIIDDRFDIRYVFLVIQSSLIKYLWKKRFSDGKTLFPKIKKSQLAEIPIKICSSINQKKFIYRFQEIKKLRLKNPAVDINRERKQVDVLVYKLYELTYPEVKIVDPEFWLSEEEYNNYKVE